MHERSDVEKVDESLPLSVRIAMLVAFPVLLYVLVVDAFGFASLL